MTVYKGYLLIIRKNIGLIMMYIGIFAGIAMIIQHASRQTTVTENFLASKMNVTVIDRDHTRLAEELTRFLKREHNFVPMTDQMEEIQQALYYRDVEYILVIPEGTQSTFLEGADTDQMLSCITIPDSTMAFYADMQINAFLNQIRTYMSSGSDFEQACSQAYALGEKDTQIDLIDVNGNAGVREDYNYFFAYMPYAFLGAAVMIISTVILEFRKRDIRRRIESSAVSFLQQNLASVVAFLLIGAAIWAACLLIQTILCKGGFWKDTNMIFYLMNSICCMFVALSLGFFSGMVSKNAASLNGINNIISLGLCFLGGIFVPIEMLGSKVLTIAKFVPTYWYATINGILGDYSVLNTAMKQTIYKGYLIQILFALACFSISLLIRKEICRKRVNSCKTNFFPL